MIGQVDPTTAVKGVMKDLFKMIGEGEAGNLESYTLSPIFLAVYRDLCRWMLRSSEALSARSPKCPLAEQ